MQKVQTKRNLELIMLKSEQTAALSHLYLLVTIESSLLLIIESN